MCVCVWENTAFFMVVCFVLFLFFLFFSIGREKDIHIRKGPNCRIVRIVNKDITL